MIGLKVRELSPRRRADVTVKVVNVGEPRTVTGRDGSTHRVSDVLVGDETGSIIMSLWDDDIGKVSAGKTVEIRNGFVAVHRGSMRLTLGREGQMQDSSFQIGEVNTQNNLSERTVEDRPRRRFY